MKKTRAAAADRDNVAEKGGSAPARECPVSFDELTIPVTPLLDHHQEISIGSVVRQSLGRLANLLPSHPAGYRQYLSRMREVIRGDAAIFSWRELKGRMRADLDRASRGLGKAESLSAGDPRRALQAYTRGVAVLRGYTLDPETLYEWSRTASATGVSEDPLGGISCVRRVAGLLARVLETLERQRVNILLPNCRLVLKEVFRFRPRGMRRSDLFQEGILGLRRAIFRYDERRGYRFSTYATYWIRQSILRCLIDKSNIIRVPHAVQEQLRRATMADSEAIRVHRVMSAPMALSPGDPDHGGNPLLQIADPSPSELQRVFRARSLSHSVVEGLECLSAREREVIERRFGLVGHSRQTLAEVGKHLRMSRERVRQIQKNALARLRQSEELLEVYNDLDAAQG